MSIYKLITFLMFSGLISCSSFEVNENVDLSLVVLKKSEQEKDSVKSYTALSELENTYDGFNSVIAINKVAEIENEYFNAYSSGDYSRYYGTEWHKLLLEYGDTAVFNEYITVLSQKEIEPKALHCTHYAMESLKAGLDSNFHEVNKHHKRIWKEREYAGWSIAFILTKFFNWKAYLVISEYSDEYERCLKNFKNDKSYNVWRQPNIPLEQVFNFDTEKESIDSLLLKNEYGWGFSHQGWHTWITRFDTLKECYWGGAPAEKYNEGEYLEPLFMSTKFTEYTDFYSHILVFPPKKDSVL